MLTSMLNTTLLWLKKKALKTVQNNKNLVIRNADKGGGSGSSKPGRLPNGGQSDSFR